MTDTALAREVIGYKQEVNVETGIEKQVEFMREFS